MTATAPAPSLTLSPPSHEARAQSLAAAVDLAIVLVALGAPVSLAYALHFSPLAPIGVVLGAYTCLVVLHIRGETPSTIGLRRASLWLTPLLAIAVVLGTWIGAAPMQWIVAGTMGTSATQTFAALLHDNAPAYVGLLLLAWTTAAFGEEIVFRGFLLDRLATTLGRSRIAWAIALVVQACLFGLSHAYQGAGGVLITGTVGLLLGAGFLACRRNLWVVIIAHGLIDTVMFTVLFLGALPVPSP